MHLQIIKINQENKQSYPTQQKGGKFSLRGHNKAS